MLPARDIVAIKEEETDGALRPGCLDVSAKMTKYSVQSAAIPFVPVRGSIRFADNRYCALIP